MWWVSRREACAAEIRGAARNMPDRLIQVARARSITSESRAKCAVYRVVHRRWVMMTLNQYQQELMPRMNLDYRYNSQWPHQAVA